MKLIKPSILKKGDTIGLISPSSGLAALFPHRLDKAVKFLNSQGYEIKEFPCTRKINGWESAPANERAKDVMDAFLDKEVNAIICTIGGYIANKTLQYLDFDVIRDNPKIFMGYSDITLLNISIVMQTGMVTFYGPCAMTQFGEYPNPLPYTLEHFNKAVGNTNPIGNITASKEWTDEALDWGRKLDLERPRELKHNNGFEWLRNGSAEGQIIGGCLPSILQLKGTKYWPKLKNKVLFIELPEGSSFDNGLSLPEVDAMLGDLKNSMAFNEINGLIVGRPFRYDSTQVHNFKKIILENTSECRFPILYGTDIGHSDPQITIPLNVNVKLNSFNNTFEITESGVI